MECLYSSSGLNQYFQSATRSEIQYEKFRIQMMVLSVCFGRIPVQRATEGNKWDTFSKEASKMVDVNIKILCRLPVYGKAEMKSKLKLKLKKGEKSNGMRRLQDIICTAFKREWTGQEMQAGSEGNTEYCIYRMILDTWLNGTFMNKHTSGKCDDCYRQESIQESIQLWLTVQNIIRIEGNWC